jgi:hypothetical protein
MKYYIYRTCLPILYWLSVINYPIYAIKHWDRVKLGRRLLQWQIQVAFGKNSEGIITVDEFFEPLNWI